MNSNPSSPRVKEFERSVRSKFNVYNSLFLSLPFQQVRKIGVLIPLLQNAAQEGLEAGQEPIGILEGFFSTHMGGVNEEEKIDFMFRVIQYVERQVVLFDAVEDAAFPGLLDEENRLSLRDYIHLQSGSRETGDTSSDLSTFSTRVVFTAHPTQFYPPSVLKIIEQLRTYLTKNDITGIDLTLQQLGLTSLTSSESPTPLDEARNILYFLEEVYYDAVGELHAEIKRSLGDGEFDNPGILKLGFWPGGDRDGNPYVTAETTESVADELRMTLMRCYHRDLADLERKLTFRGVDAEVSRLRKRAHAAMFDPTVILPATEILTALKSIRKQLLSEYSGLYLENVDAFVEKVRIFGTHFASLDIRQNHAVHRRIVTEILKQNGVIDLSLDELTTDALVEALLRKEMDIRESELSDDLARDTIQTIRLIGRIQQTNGERGCDRYIISHAEDPYSVLFVFALLRWSLGVEHIPVDVIPLFESVHGMGHAADIMHRLYEIPTYRDHVRRRDDRQTMMLGFSDGTKDGGYLKANWSILKTKEALSGVSSQYGIKAVFFDGRGGPPARGGGKTHRFYASQSGDVANHAIEVTIQGQVITSRYGTKAHFRHNCEQLLAAGMHRNVFESENAISDDARKLLDELAEISYRKYTELKNHPSFFPYLEKMSTLRYYARAKIGSRPDRRGKKEELDLDDLRAIPFVGSWSQLKQNVPGYYGVGTAFQKLIDDERLDALQALFRDVPFFKTLLLNSMMSLSKCNFSLTGYIAENETFRGFWHMLYEEYERSKRCALLVSGYDELMQEEPVSRNSIAVRENIVLPLLVIQQYALQKVENGDPKSDIYEKIVTRSLYGNINASRNSA